MVQNRRRLLLLVVLVGGLAAMSVHYGTVVDDQRPYPTTAALVADYEGHVGEEIYLWMRVETVHPDAVVVRTGDLQLTVSGPVPGVAPGDVVQVHGTLRPDHVVEPERVVVSSRADRRVMFGLSALAAGLVAALFLRRWTVDTDAGAFVPRGGD